jgi:hypothetical protein
MDALTKGSARADPTLPDERVERTRACGHACPAANAAAWTVHVNYGVERWQGSRPTPASRHRLEMAKAPC